MTVQEKLKKLRADKHFSDKDVAEILGMKLDAYSRLEHGVGKIGSFLKNRLALLYDKDPDYFADDPEIVSEPEPEIASDPEIAEETIAGPSSEPEIGQEPGQNALNDKETTMTFGEKLVLLRTMKGLSVREVADEIGVSSNTVLNYEKNIRMPRNKTTLDALAQLFDRTAEELTDDSVVILPEDTPERVDIKEEETATEASGEGSAPTEVQEPQAEDKTFGEFLSELRVDKGLKQQDMADRLGMTLHSYRAMEKKDVRPETIEEYERLAEILGCETADLTAGDEELALKKQEKAEPAEIRPEAMAEALITKIDTIFEPSESYTVESPAKTEAVINAAKVTVEKFSVNPDMYLKVGVKEKIRVGKKVARVEISDKSIAKVKMKGKKIIIKGRKEGTTTVTAYDKKDRELGSWVIHQKEPTGI